MVLVMFSCKGNKAAESDDEAVNDSVDSSLEDTAQVDTMEQLIAETPMPKAADELFDDFFFNFADDSHNCSISYKNKKRNIPSTETKYSAVPLYLKTIMSFPYSR